MSFVGSLPGLTSDLDRACRDMDEAGYCLVEGALSKSEVEWVRTRLVEQAVGEARAGVARYDTGAHPSKHEGEGVNQRVGFLINKGRAFQHVALQPGVGQVLRHVLGERFLMTSFTANITAPGCDLQELHQDQGYVTRPFPLYAIVTNVVWILDDVDARNGGTRVVPGSHLWDGPIQGDPDLVVGVEAPAGTALVVDGRTYHGAGANRSDRRRHVLLSNYCRAWVRQQENPFLALAPEVEADLSPDLRRLLGYKTWGTLGGVGEREAMDAEGYVHRPSSFTTRLR